MLGVSPQTISNMVARGVLQSGGNIVSPSGRNNISVIYSEDLFNMLKNMDELVDVDKSGKELAKMKEDFDLRLKEYKNNANMDDLKQSLKLFRKAFGDAMKSFPMEQEDKDIIDMFIGGLSMTKIAKAYDKPVAKVQAVINHNMTKITDGLQQYETLLKEKDKLADVICKQRELIDKLKEDIRCRDLIINPGEVPAETQEDKIEEIRDMREVLSRPVTSLDLSVKCQNILKCADINHIHQLVQLQPNYMMRFRGCGKTTLDSLQSALEYEGLHFNMDVTEYGFPKYDAKKR